MKTIKTKRLLDIVVSEIILIRKRKKLEQIRKRKLDDLLKNQDNDELFI